MVVDLRPSVIETTLIRGTINGSIARDLVIGPFIVAFAVQVAGLSNAQITWFLSLIPLVVLARYPFLDVIRQFPRISVVIWARYIQAGCIIALLLLPTEWITLPVLIAIAMAFVFGNEFLQNAVWMNLIAEMTDPETRGRFLGRLRTWKQITNMAFSALGFVLVGDQLSRGEHRILLLVVLALLLNSLYWYKRLPMSAPPETTRDYAGRGQFWDILTTHPLLRRQLALTFVTAVLYWPILIVYLVGTLNLPADLLMLTLVVMMLGSILSEYVWGLLSDRHGIRLVYVVYFLGALLLCPLLYSLPDFATLEAGSRSAWLATGALVLFYLVTGILAAGNLMGSSIYRAHYLRAPGGFHALNILTALDQLIKAGLTAVGGMILIYASHDGAPAAGSSEDPFKLITIAVMIAAIAVGLWITAGIRIESRSHSDDEPIQTARIGLETPEKRRPAPWRT